MTNYQTEQKRNSTTETDSFFHLLGLGMIDFIAEAHSEYSGTASRRIEE